MTSATKIFWMTMLIMGTISLMVYLIVVTDSNVRDPAPTSEQSFSEAGRDSSSSPQNIDLVTKKYHPTLSQNDSQFENGELLFEWNTGGPTLIKLIRQNSNRNNHITPVTFHIDVSRDGQLIAALHQQMDSKRIQLYHIESKTILTRPYTPQEHEKNQSILSERGAYQWITSLRFNANADRVFLTSQFMYTAAGTKEPGTDFPLTTGQLAVFDVHAPNAPARSEETDEEIWSVAFHPTGDWYVLGFGNANNYSKFPEFDQTGTAEEVRARSAAAMNQWWDTPDKLSLQFYHSAESSTPFKSISAHAGPVSLLEYSPDGSRLISAGPRDRFLRFWQSESGEEIEPPLVHSAGIATACFTPNGQYVLTACYDGVIRVWDAATHHATGVTVRHIETEPAIGMSDVHIAVHPDGTHFATVAGDKFVRLWTLPEGRPQGRAIEHEDYVTRTRFSPDGRFLASIGMSGSIKLSTANEGFPVEFGYVDDDEDLSKINPSSVKFPRDAHFVPHRNLLLTSSLRGVRVWNLPPAPPGGNQALPNRAEDVTRIQRVPESEDRIIPSSDDNRPNSTTAEPDNLIKKLSGHTGYVREVIFTPDGSQALSCGQDAIIRLWDVKSGQKLKEYRGHTADVTSVILIANGSGIVSTSADKTIRVWDVKSGEEISRMDGHSAGVYHSAILPDEKHILSCSHDGALRLWNLKTSDLIREFPKHKTWLRNLAVSHDGSRAVTGGGESTLQVWDIVTGQVVGSLSGHTNRATTLNFSPDSTRLVSGSFDNTIRIWNWESGETIKTLTGHQDIVHHVEFSPDGKSLVSASYDGTIRIWDVDSGKERYVFRGHTGRVYHATFSPDGKQVLSCGTDGVIRLWQVPQK